MTPSAARKNSRQNAIKLDPKPKAKHLRFLMNYETCIGETYKIEDDNLVLISGGGAAKGPRWHILKQSRENHQWET